MAYSRPPTMPSQALQKGSENASRHLGEQRTQGRVRCYSVLLLGKQGGHQGIVASPPTGTLTFLFTDIEGSTRLWEHDAPAMQAALARHDELLRSVIGERGGYVFKTVGDAFCAVFPTAPDALEAAISAQRALHTGSQDEESLLRVLIAIRTGDTEERGGDYFGPTLNRVARLLSAG